jgi:hypothetical protein
MRFLTFRRQDAKKDAKKGKNLGALAAKSALKDKRVL